MNSTKCHCGRSGWEAEECREIHCPQKCTSQSENPDRGVISPSPTGSNARQVGGAHYSADGIQHWDFVMMHRLNYLEGNATKYISRWRKKNGVQDLEKAEHYVSKLIELAEARLIFPLGDATPMQVDDFCLQYGLSSTGEWEIINVLSSSWTTESLHAARQLLSVLIAQEKARV